MSVFTVHTESGPLKVRPRRLPVDLTVTMATHGTVRLTGVARFFPADTVHLERSTAVIGDGCVLRQEEHFHFHHVEVSFDRLVESPEALDALRVALAEPGDSRHTRHFRDAVRGLCAPPPEPETDNQARLRVRQPVSVTTRASAVVLGEGTRVTRKVEFISELTTIDAVELLARDSGLVNAFLDHLTSVDLASREPLTSLFAAAAGQVEDLELIRGAQDLRDPGTSVFRAVGHEVVSDAVGVLLGTGNRLDRSLEVRRPDVYGLAPSQGLEVVTEVAEHAAELAELQRAVAEQAVDEPEPEPEPHRRGYDFDFSFGF
ncbi:hypothetical protein MRQ36_12245 [Micromonospora sp. R77]|uniref:hypothetical protein n=1 Tax=Micromonospora sp. R77 TaxID=2925836 RepID=UPI001F6197DB|nr:hypothetical protein [Micromonospora sp. R77]MCI4063301.1 hypothetical protein [Micromonospora sp. R77]